MKLHTGLISCIYNKAEDSQLLVNPQIYQKILDGEEVEMEINIYDPANYPYLTETGLRIKGHMEENNREENEIGE